jgi:hypothetical protein
MAPKTTPSYEWAKTLNFTERGNALPYLESGWAAPEAGWVWTDNLNARALFTVKPPTSDVSMVLSCFPFLGEGKLRFQEVHVFVNFLRVGFATVKEPSEIEITIPRQVFASPNTIVDLYMPRACSPSSLGVSDDLRELGIAVNRLILIQS